MIHTARVNHHHSQANQVVSKVVKHIDVVDIPSYRIKQHFLNRNDEKHAPKADTGEAQSLRARILGHSLFPNIYNRTNLLKEI
jgi:hypothetical protein